MSSSVTCCILNHFKYKNQILMFIKKHLLFLFFIRAPIIPFFFSRCNRSYCAGIFHVFWVGRCTGDPIIVLKYGKSQIFMICPFKSLHEFVCVFQDVDASEIKVQVCVYAFDLLYLNGEVRP